MSKQLDEHAEAESDSIAEAVNKEINDFLQTAVTLTEDNLSTWVTELVSRALVVASPKIWQMATDTVGQVFLSGETDGLNLTPEQAREAGEWVLSWERVDGDNGGTD